MACNKIRMAITATLANAVTVGIASTYSSTATESMKKTGHIRPTENEISWIGSILPLGAILGGLIAGYVSDKTGRKNVMVCLSFPVVLGWLLIAYAPSIGYVYAGRFLTGICCGLICVVTPMYIVEVSTPEMRGKHGTLFQQYICFGIVISSGAGYVLPWEWLALIGAIVGVISLLHLLPIPESPRWLVRNGKQAEAVHAVNFMYGNTNDPSVNQLMNESLGVSSTSTIHLREILQPTFYKPALLSIALMFFQQFSGSNAILYYTVSIFKQSSSFSDPRMGNTCVAVFMYIFTGLTSMTMDRLGRKKSLYVSGLVMCVALNVMSVYLLLSESDPTLKSKYRFIPLLCLIFYISGFSLGLGPIPWLMMSEMSPVRGRSIVCGLGTAFSWIFVFIITKTFLQVENLVGNFGAYWIYSGFCLMTCFFAYFFLPETKGKSLEDIENYFAGGSPQLQPLPELNGDSFMNENSDDFN